CRRTLNVEVTLFDDLVHVLRGILRTGAIDQLCRHAHCSTSGGHGFEHHGARADARVFADFDVAQHLCTHREKHTAAHLWMAIPGLFAGSSEGDAMQHGDVVLNDGCLADDYTGRMIDHDPSAELCCRMNVYVEQLRHSTLEKQSHGPPVLVPEPM